MRPAFFLFGIVLAVAGCSVTNYEESFPARTDVVPSEQLLKTALGELKKADRLNEARSVFVTARSVSDQHYQMTLGDSSIATGYITYEIGDKPVIRQVLRITWNRDEEEKVEEGLVDYDLKTGRSFRRFFFKAYSWGGVVQAHAQNLIP